MDANTKHNTSALSSSTKEQRQSNAEDIAISATDLIKLIESGQGDDVNELVSRLLQDRQAA
ncbi:MAG: hypothetical protein P1U42_04220 [Phycisphaerales bacterium]|nr:hypothetical protein [Phycisphaerales bacterium]